MNNNKKQFISSARSQEGHQEEARGSEEEGQELQERHHDNEDGDQYDHSGPDQGQAQPNKFTPFPDLIALPSEQSSSCPSSGNNSSGHPLEKSPFSFHSFSFGGQPPDISNVPGRAKSSFIHIDSLNAPPSSSFSSNSGFSIPYGGALASTSSFFSADVGSGGTSGVVGAPAATTAGPSIASPDLFESFSRPQPPGPPPPPSFPPSYAGASRNVDPNGLQSLNQAIFTLQNSIDRISRSFDHRLAQLEDKLDHVTSELRRVRPTSDVRADPMVLDSQMNAAEIIRNELQNFNQTQRQVNIFITNFVFPVIINLN